MPNNNEASNASCESASGGGQRDHVAAEQRQLHARAALRDAVAHGRHAAGDLRGGAGDARRGADHFRDTARTAGAPTTCRCTT